MLRRIFESGDFSPLGLQLSNHELGEQMKRLNEGTLDLAVFVVDEDAKLISEAMRGACKWRPSST